jgi:hypothetical protein
VKVIKGVGVPDPEELKVIVVEVDGIALVVLEADWVAVTELVGDALGGVHADCILEEIARTIP